MDESRRPSQAAPTTAADEGRSRLSRFFTRAAIRPPTSPLLSGNSAASPAPAALDPDRLTSEQEPVDAAYPHQVDSPLTADQTTTPDQASIAESDEIELFDGPPGRLAQTIGLSLLIGFSLLGGVSFAIMADPFRLGILDPDLAHRIGYLGEGAKLVHLRGIGDSAESWIAGTAFAGTGVSYALVIVQRQALRERRPHSLTWGVLFCAMVPGAVWISTAWVSPNPDDWNLTQRVVLHSDLWLPAGLALIGLALIARWLRAGVIPDLDPVAAFRAQEGAS